jgi:hypothetical protein
VGRTSLSGVCVDQVMGLGSPGFRGTLCCSGKSRWPRFVMGFTLNQIPMNFMANTGTKIALTSINSTVEWRVTR